MLTAVWLMLSSLLYSLQLSPGSFPRPLTVQEEQCYLKKAREGDMEARNVLIERNLRLVAHIMKKYYSQTADQEDLISVGTIGLIKGISTFDPDKGVRLATYAARCVENATLSRVRFSIHIQRRWMQQASKKRDPYRICSKGLAIESILGRKSNRITGKAALGTAIFTKYSRDGA